MSINISDIEYEDRLREQRAFKIYEKLLDECCEHIRTMYKYYRKKEVLFSVPLNYLDDDDYDYRACLCYIIDTLRDSGFYVRYLKPITIYISWVNKEQENKKIKNQKKLVMENILTSKTINGQDKKVKLITYK